MKDFFMLRLNDWQKQITLFLSAQTISLFGSAIVQYAIIWHITLTTSSGSALMLSTICGFLPQIVISFFAGVWVDRYDRKKLIMLSDSMIALATLVVAVLFLYGSRHIGLLYAVLVVRSVGTGIQMPAVNAFIPQIVPVDKLMRVNGINSSLASVIMFMSPAVSGIVLSLAALEATFFLDVITAVIGVGMTALVKATNYQCQKKRSLTYYEEIRDGFDFLKGHRFIRNLLLFQIVVVILVSPSAFLTPLLVSRSFGPEVWRLSLSEMAFSAGAFAGGILISWWGGFANKIHTAILAGALYGLLAAAIGLAPEYYSYLVFNTLIGITMPLYNTPITVIIQEKVEAGMQGRIFSFMQIATSTALPLGMVIFGPLADRVSVQSILVFGGLSVVAVTAYVFMGKKLG